MTCRSVPCAPQLYTNFSCCPTPSCTPICDCDCSCNSSQDSCAISKLADFCHFGGGEKKCCQPDPCCKPKPCCCQSDPCCKPKPCCCQPKPCCPPNPCCQPKRRCPPPMPPCAPTCITDRCKDLPAHRLRNVDVLEELCYFVPGDTCQPMDCYTIDCCGNVEKLCDDCDCCCCDDQCCSCPKPVKYSRRQRFTFNDANNGAPSAFDPWPFNDDCGGCGDGNGRRGGGAGRGCNSGAGGACNPLMGGSGGPKHNPCLGGRQYTYRPESPIDCTEFMPPDSGIYYFDRQRRVFIPERDLPKPPEIIEKEVEPPEVEEYEILEEENAHIRRILKEQEASCKPQVQPVVQPIIMAGGNTCNPCPPPCDPCNPCGPPPCNPCCPPPCNPCMPPCCPPPCNPCCPPPCMPCNPYCPPPCNPCMPPCCPPPCNPCNPFMNPCGGILPMVIPMCPQQPAGPMMMPGGGGMPFPMPPMPKKKKKKSKKSSKSGTTYGTGTSTTTDNIIVPAAPEDLLERFGDHPGATDPGDPYVQQQAYAQQQGPQQYAAG